MSHENRNKPWIAGARDGISYHPDYDAARLWLRLWCLWDLDNECVLKGLEYDAFMHFTQKLSFSDAAVPVTFKIPSTGDTYYLKLDENDEVPK